MKLLGQILFPLVIIGLGFLGFKLLKGSKPELQSKEPKEVLPIVDVVEVSPEDHVTSIESFGTVQSYFETTLTPQVSGRIIEVSDAFRVGQLVREGDVLARIDDIDYKSALATVTAAKVNAQQVLAEEEIQVKQASEDWVASGRSLSSASDFVLRKPQLAAAKANIESARADEVKAQEDIRRAVIRAPFDAMVIERTASVGNLATQQQSLGSLIAIERAEVRLPLTPEQLARVDLSSITSSESKPIEIRISSPVQPDVEWPAKLVRREAEVDQANQVTYVIAEVDQPYTGHDMPLTVGTFVNAYIPAKLIKGSYAVSESSLVNDHYVWVVGSENKLHKLKAERVQSFNKQVYLKVENNDLVLPLKIVTRPLTNFKSNDEVKLSNTAAE